MVTLAVVMLLLLPAVAQAQPNVHGFYGSVMLNGASVEDGTKVTAMVGGNAVAVTYTGEGTLADSQYSINVFPQTGDFEGQTVTFAVGDEDASAMESKTWVAGGRDQLDLNAYTTGKTKKITLNPTKGAATNVIGEGFSHGRMVQIKFAGEMIGSAQVDSEGNFYTTIVPTKTDAGSYTVEASDGVGTSATAQFQVTAGGATGGGIQSVTVNTLTAGQNASADYNADTGALTLNIPQGEKGATGSAGAPGEDGDDAGSSVLAIVALIIAIIAVILAVVFGMRAKQQPAA